MGDLRQSRPRDSPTDRCVESLAGYPRAIEVVSVEEKANVQRGSSRKDPTWQEDVLTATRQMAFSVLARADESCDKSLTSCVESPTSPSTVLQDVQEPSTPTTSCCHGQFHTESGATCFLGTMLQCLEGVLRAARRVAFSVANTHQCKSREPITGTRRLQRERKGGGRYKRKVSEVANHESLFSFPNPIFLK